MSNNKQTMKLYTEEQVTELTTAAYYAGQNHNIFIFGNKYDGISPIELPSDEEIERKIANRLDKEFMVCSSAFRDGAKWMRNKIQGGNNES